MKLPKGSEMTTSDAAVLADSEFEEVVHCVDDETGLDSVIAIHDTTLGPSLGGIRMRAYPDHEAAAADAKQLAQAMSYKAALAGLALGGGKSVINADPRSANRNQLLVAHARYIEKLRGRYIPTIDMGTTVEDMALVASVTSTVSSQRRDLSSFTARGVVAAIRAAVRATDEHSLQGVLVGVQGLGNVGSETARLLAAEGATLVVADIDQDRASRIATELGATRVAPDEVMTAAVDVLCPCAIGGVVTGPVVEGMSARYLIGSANNLLDTPALAADLRDKGVIFVPDFIANAGGLIACAAEVQGIDSTLESDVDEIGTTTTTLLRAASVSGRDTMSVAVDLAKERIDARRRPSTPAQI
jgi:leucine dehydrogenase